MPPYPNCSTTEGFQTPKCVDIQPEIKWLIRRRPTNCSIVLRFQRTKSGCATGVFWDKLAAPRKTDDDAHRASWQHHRSYIKIWRKRSGSMVSPSNLSLNALFSNFADGQAWVVVDLILHPGRHPSLCLAIQYYLDSSLAGPFPLCTSSPSCPSFSTSKIQPITFKPSDMPEKLYTQPTNTDPMVSEFADSGWGSVRICSR